MAKKSSAQCSAAGKALAQCRWGPAKAKKKAKPKPRKSRRLAGQGPVRQPEPKKKAARPRKQKVAKRTAAGKRAEEILVPGLNPKKGDMKSFLEQQRRLWL